MDFVISEMCNWVCLHQLKWKKYNRTCAYCLFDLVWVGRCWWAQICNRAWHQNYRALLTDNNIPAIMPWVICLYEHKGPYVNLIKTKTLSLFLNNFDFLLLWSFLNLLGSEQGNFIPGCCTLCMNVPYLLLTTS